MDQNLLHELEKVVSGDVVTDEQTLTAFSHDASLFEVKPQAVVCPKNEKDVVDVIKFVSAQKKNHPDLSITGRSAGTDMSGGSINDSVLLSFTKYFNKTPVVHKDYATTQPGVYYRDFEKETLKHNLIFPSYPASREICAMGGIVNNNSGGEKSLQYGKTENYVTRVKVVLSDGSIAEFKPLSEKELDAKKKLKTMEGKIYREMHQLITKNYDEIQKSKPTVTKNSAGYDLWNVWNPTTKVFDLTKLWVGAQGTLGMLLEADIHLVPIKKHHEMMIIFLHDYAHLNQVIDTVLPLGPESFESYDDNTLKLALRFFPAFAKLLGTKGIIQTGLDFLPEFLMVLFGGLPKLILQVDFAGDNPDELRGKIAYLREVLKPLHPKTRIAVDKQEQKYWLIRRESFNLLRQKIHNMHTAPFIDDFVIDPHDIAKVLPEISSIVKHHKGFIFTIAGHVGNGNFHIIPLTDIQKKTVRDAIPVIANKVYEIVHKYHGSITGEHNDGLIRTPYLKEMYDEKMLHLFEETKNIFDPQHIFNPRKKVNGSMKFALDHIRQSW
ncbi:MAG TPA: FAD-binding oxidoreductase [Patescibacteria group bacterium]|nr:FAD-binding oxidoreductase [Patescibacteria group bacterium]